MPEMGNKSLEPKGCPRFPAGPIKWQIFLSRSRDILLMPGWPRWITVYSSDGVERDETGHRRTAQGSWLKR